MLSEEISKASGQVLFLRYDVGRGDLKSLGQLSRGYGLCSHEYFAHNGQIQGIEVHRAERRYHGVGGVLAVDLGKPLTLGTF